MIILCESKISHIYTLTVFYSQISALALKIQCQSTSGLDLDFSLSWCVQTKGAVKIGVMFERVHHTSITSEQVIVSLTTAGELT